MRGGISRGADELATVRDTADLAIRPPYKFFRFYTIVRAFV